MKRWKAPLTRRDFLKGSLYGAGGLAVLAGMADPVLSRLADGLVKLGVPVPWYRRGQVTTTYNYCDMCPRAAASSSRA